MDLLEAFEARGVEWKDHQSREDEIKICCPFCTERGETPDTKFRLGINLQSGKMGCFNCGKGSQDRDYTFRELSRVLETGELELAERSRQKKKKKREKVKLPEDFKLIKCQGSDSRWNRVAYEYLMRRGVSDAQIQAKKIGYSLVGKFRYRVILPVYEGEALVGLVGRVFVRDMEPPYLNSIGEKTLYNLPTTHRNKLAILLEGAFDALAVERQIGQEYFTDDKLKPDALAVLGHDLTDRQLELLEPYETIILWMDPDVAGVKGLLRTAPQLQRIGKRVKLVVPKMDGVTLEYDPSELTKPEMRSILRGAVDWSEELGQALKAKIVFQGE